MSPVTSEKIKFVSTFFFRLLLMFECISFKLKLTDKKNIENEIKQTQFRFKLESVLDQAASCHHIQLNKHSFNLFNR